MSIINAVLSPCSDLSVNSSEEKPAMAQSLKTKLKINSSAANSVNEGEDADSSWQLSAFDLQRSPHHIISNPNSTICITPKHFEEFKCPVCLDLLENTLTAMECLHRFCAACISSALRSGNKECPTCRTKLVSKRSLRPDPNFDALIGVLFPDRSAVNNYQLQLLRSSSSHATHSVGATKALADSANHMQDEVTTAVTESTKRLGREMEEGMRKQAELSAPFIMRKRPNFSASAANTPRDNSGSVLENDESVVHGADFAADNAEEKDGKIDDVVVQQPAKRKYVRKKLENSNAIASKSNVQESYMESNELVRIVLTAHEQQRWSEYKIRPRYLLMPLNANVDTICRYLHYCIHLQCAGKTYADVKPARHDEAVQCADASVKVSDFDIHIASSGSVSARLNPNTTLIQICDKFLEHDAKHRGKSSDCVQATCIKLLYKYEPDD